MSFLRRALDADLAYTVRDDINVARYAMKILTRGEAHDEETAVRRALEMASGKEGREAAELDDLW